MSGYTSNSIFWIETSKIAPNPFQPRRDFDEHALHDLADSIRQYGVLQPLVVTRSESYRPDGGMEVSYELIAGERRLRAAQIAQLQQVPVIIRAETDNKVKLELAIIENLQREDLNPIDRAYAFEQLHREFNLTHAEIGKRMVKSRVYVSNTLRLLALPDDIKRSLAEGRITEGHTRPLLMLVDRPEEQVTLFREIVLKNLSVRDAERIARRVAQDRVRKKEFVIDPRIRDYELKISENLGTRVQIEAGEQGGKIVIDYFTQQDLDKILQSLARQGNRQTSAMPSLAQEYLQASTSLRFENHQKGMIETSDDSIFTSAKMALTQEHEGEGAAALQSNQSEFDEPAAVQSSQLEVEENVLAQSSQQEVEKSPEPIIESMYEQESELYRRSYSDRNQQGYQSGYQQEHQNNNPQNSSWQNIPQKNNPHINQMPVYYGQPPQKKKGFFGRLFG